MKLSISILLAFALPLIWIAATPKAKDNYLGKKTTLKRLTQTKRATEKFKRKYHRLPYNLAEIRAYAKTIWPDYTPHDGFGRRLVYLPLTKSYFVIKSFGADFFKETTETSDSQNIFTLPKQAKNPPTYKSPEDSDMRLYPAILLMGARSPANDFIGRIFIDQSKGTRNLVVRSLNKPSHIMIASHPRVEEFFWLPNGTEIIYSATGSNRYQDGIYHWNVLTNKTSNILMDLEDKFKHTSENESDRFHISLSSLDKKGEKLYVYIFPNDGGALDPNTFFSSQSFFEINLPKHKKKKDMFFSYLDTYPQEKLFEYQQFITQDIDPTFEGTSAQRSFASLQHSGNLQEILDTWQEFAAAHPNSPMFPYSLWWLGVIYGQGHEALIETSSIDALTLKAYGAELTKALARLPTAPTYLRAIGAQIHKNLMLSQPIGLKMVNLQDTPSSGKSEEQK